MAIRHFGYTDREAFITDDKSVLLGKLEEDLPAPRATVSENNKVTEDFCGKGIENQLVNAVILHTKKNNTTTSAPCTFSRTRFANEHDVPID